MGCIPNWHCSGSKLMNDLVVAFSSQQKSTDTLKYFLSDNWIILLSNYGPAFCEAYSVLWFELVSSTQQNQYYNSLSIVSMFLIVPSPI